jgi:hypothetical protein
MGLAKTSRLGKDISTGAGAEATRFTARHPAEIAECNAAMASNRHLPAAAQAGADRHATAFLSPRVPARSPPGGPVVRSGKGQTMKKCKLCKYSKFCNDLPGICVLMPYVAIAAVVVSLGYLFVTQEFM